jgi:hypothetical protein
MATRFLLVNEYVDHSAPTGQVASDVQAHLQRSPGVEVESFCGRGKYSPGGFRIRRLANLVWVHGVLFFRLAAFRAKLAIRRESGLVCVFTSPPLIHLTCIVLCRLLGLPVVAWLMDIHPDVAFVKVRRKGSSEGGRLGLLNSSILPLAQGVVVLDEGMRERLLANGVSRILVLPPWSTYAEPAFALKRPPSSGPIRLVYAGNYGWAHDFRPFVKAFGTLPLEKQLALNIDVVGVSPAARVELAKLLEHFPGPVRFHSRFESFPALLAFLREADFGIVSLRHSCKGLLCPSKILTYVSQGLPFLFAGPTPSLASTLRSAGWGLGVQEFVSLLQKSDAPWSQLVVGETFENPRGSCLDSLEFFFEAILGRKLASSTELPFEGRT